MAMLPRWGRGTGKARGAPRRTGSCARSRFKPRSPHLSGVLSADATESGLGLVWPRARGVLLVPIRCLRRRNAGEQARAIQRRAEICRDEGRQVGLATGRTWLRRPCCVLQGRNCGEARCRSGLSNECGGTRLRARSQSCRGAARARRGPSPLHVPLIEREASLRPDQEAPSGPLLNGDQEADRGTIEAGAGNVGVAKARRLRVIRGTCLNCNNPLQPFRFDGYGRMRTLARTSRYLWGAPRTCHRSGSAMSSDGRSIKAWMSSQASCFS